MEFPYKTLKQLLAGKPAGAYSVSPNASVFSVLQLMAEKEVGLLLVLDGDRLAGVVSERDCARKVELRGKTAKDTPVREIMTEKVFQVTVDHTVPQCMALMNEKGVRHLPVVEGNRVIGVLSNRDLVKEVVSHHEHVIHDMELERMITLNPDPSSY